MNKHIVSFLLLLMLCSSIILSEFLSRKYLVPPKYGVLFSVNSAQENENCVESENREELRFENNKVYLESKYEKFNRACRYSAKLFYFDPIKNRVSKIDFGELEQDLTYQVQDMKRYELIKFNHWELLDRAPDGYNLKVDSYRDRPTLLFFDQDNFLPSISLTKFWGRFALDLSDQKFVYYDEGDIALVAWVNKAGGM